MLTLEQIIEKLEDRKYKAIAEKTGLSRHTVAKVAKGNTRHVTYEVIKTLSDYFLSEG